MSKSNVEKWSQIWAFLLKNGLKSPRRRNKKFIKKNFICPLRLNVFLPPLLEVQCLIDNKHQNVSILLLKTTHTLYLFTFADKSTDTKNINHNKKQISSLQKMKIFTCLLYPTYSILLWKKLGQFELSKKMCWNLVTLYKPMVRYVAYHM